MFNEIVAIARDWSILILSIPILVGLALQVFLLWYVTRAIRSFAPRVRPVLRTVSDTIARVADSVETARRKVESPIVTARAAPAQVTGFLRTLRGGDKTAGGDLCVQRHVERWPGRP